MRRQAPRNLHCAIESLAADRFRATSPLFFRLSRGFQWLAHEDVHEWQLVFRWLRGQPFWRAAGAREGRPKVCLR